MISFALFLLQFSRFTFPRSTYARLLLSAKIDIYMLDSLLLDCHLFFSSNGLAVPRFSYGYIDIQFSAQITAW